MSNKKQIPEEREESDDLDEELLLKDIKEDRSSLVGESYDPSCRLVPSLKSLCEKVAAEFLVEPRNAIQLLEIADSLEAHGLRKYCEDIALRNLAYIFTVSAPAIASASPETLAMLEKLLDARSSEPWSYRRLPTPTATFPAVIFSKEEDNDEMEYIVPRNQNHPLLRTFGDPRADLFLQGESGADEAVVKQVRALRKKLQQIEILEAKHFSGHALDGQQIAKLQTRSLLESALAELGFPVELNTKLSFPGLSDFKVNKKADISRKQRRRSKQKELEKSDALSESHELMDSVKGFPDDKSPRVFEEKKIVDADLIVECAVTEEQSPCSPRGISNSHKNKSTHATPTKKKNKKGGLSMFLSGALDETPKPPPPPPTPKSEGPAWGGAKCTTGPASLRDIQNEQSKVITVMCSKPKEKSEDTVDSASSGQVKLSSFMRGSPTSPIAVAPARAVPAPEGERSTPPWSSSGSSPVQYRPSLRDIQIQQV